MARQFLIYALLVAAGLDLAGCATTTTDSSDSRDFDSVTLNAALANVALAEADRFYRRGRIREALDTLDTVPAQYRNRDWRLFRALADQSVWSVSVPRNAALPAVANTKSLVAIPTEGGRLVLHRIDDGTVRQELNPPKPSLKYYNPAFNASDTELFVADHESVIEAYSQETRIQSRTRIEANQARRSRMRSRERPRPQDETASRSETHPRAFVLQRVVADSAGARIATLRGDGSVSVWELSSGNEVSRIRYADEGRDIGTFEISPDGTKLLIANKLTHVGEFSIDSGELLNEYRHNRVGFTSAHYSSDGSQIVTAGYRKWVRVWDSESHQELMRLIPGDRDEDTVTALYAQFSPDGRTIAAAGGDSVIRIYDAIYGTHLKSYSGHSRYYFEQVRRRGGYVSTVAFGPDSRYVISRGWDDTVRAWDTHDANSVSDQWLASSLTNGDGSISLEIHPVYGWAVYVFSEPSHEQLYRFRGHFDDIAGLAFTPDDTRFLSWSTDGSCKLVDATDGKLVHSFNTERPVTGAAMSPDLERIVTVNDNGDLRCWNAVTGAEIFEINLHIAGDIMPTFNRDGTRLRIDLRLADDPDRIASRVIDIPSATSK